MNSTTIIFEPEKKANNKRIKETIKIDLTTRLILDEDSHYL